MGTIEMMRNRICQEVQDAVKGVRAGNPLVPSITNTVTVNFVANAQLAVGGSAAMIYLPDEGEQMAEMGGAMYINMGTDLPVYAETLPRTVRALGRYGRPWVLDPVGIGAGALRKELLYQFREFPPAVIRGNASEILAIAKLWGPSEQAGASRVRGVDATDDVEAARNAAVGLAQFTGGAVAVSGPVDLVTDGSYVLRAAGGSHFLPKITGAGCSLGGVMAVYAAQVSPWIAAIAGTIIYNLAGKRAEAEARGPASFQMHFLDELYLLTAEGKVSVDSFDLEEV